MELINPQQTINDHKLVVRVSTSMWHDEKGIYIRKNIRFLMRKSKGFNIINEDCKNIGADEVVPRITNMHDITDGIYEVAICNESRDWESGLVDDYDYILIPHKED